MTKFVVLIHAAPHEALARSALQFARAANDAETLSCVFFQQDAIYHGLPGPDAPADEFNPFQAWQDFAQQTQTPLLCCSASLSRRGLSIKDSPLATGFEIAGLGQLLEHLNHSDKLVQF